jgi:hypothetical protein
MCRHLRVAAGVELGGLMGLGLCKNF